MALIECRECGKKISNTSSMCIHCGAPLHNDTIISDNIVKVNPGSIGERDDNKQNTKQKKESPSEQKKFGDLTASEKELFEKEFIESDKWAGRYLRQKTEFAKFRRPLYWLFYALAAVVVIIKNFVGQRILEIENLIVNPSLLIVSGMCFVMLLTVCLIMFLYGLFGAIYFSATHKKYVYSKKFMIWLSKEKNILYTPPFAFDREKRIFDNIYVE